MRASGRESKCFFPRTLHDIRTALTESSDFPQVALLKAYTGAVEQLGTVERFFLEVMDIPRLGERIKVLLVKEQYASTAERIR